MIDEPCPSARSASSATYTAEMVLSRGRGVEGPSGTLWEAMKASPNWTLYLAQLDASTGKLAKVPTIDGRTPHSAAEAAVLTYANAISKMEELNGTTGQTRDSDGGVGIGYRPVRASPVRAYDFDKCVLDGRITDPEVASIVAENETYIEISPSGTGLRMWAAPIGDKIKINAEQGAILVDLGGSEQQCPTRGTGSSLDGTPTDDVGGGGAHGFEYSGANGRFFTFTGDHFPGSTSEILPAPKTRAFLFGKTPLNLSSGGSGQTWDGPLEDVDEALAETKLQAALSRNALFAKRWAGDGTGMSDTSRSAFDFSVLGFLASNDFTFSEAVHLMLSQYEQASRAVDDWRDGDENQMRRDFCRASGRAASGGRPSAEDEFCPVQLDESSKPKVLWLTEDSYAEPSLDQAWLIDDMLGPEGIGVLYGKPGAGKTFLALDMALSVSIGARWMGRDVESCDVVYVASEGGAQNAANRVYGWRKENGIGDTSHFHCTPANFNLVGEEIALSDAIEQQAINPGLIVIDTLSQNFGGGDENGPADMGRFVAAIKALQRKFSCFVLVVHHSGKDESRGARGHSRLIGAVDFEGEVSSTGSDQKRFRVTKNRDGPAGHDTSFRLKIVSLGFSEKGKEITTCVATASSPGHAIEAEWTPRKKTSQLQETALDCLEKWERTNLDFDVEPMTLEEWITLTKSHAHQSLLESMPEKTVRSSIRKLTERTSPPLVNTDPVTEAVRRAKREV